MKQDSKVQDTLGRRVFNVKGMRLVEIDTGRNPFPFINVLEIVTEKGGKEQVWIPQNSEGHPLSFKMTEEKKIPVEEIIVQSSSEPMEES